MLHRTIYQIGKGFAEHVDVLFSDMGLKRTCESEPALRRAYGPKGAQVVMRRLSDLQAAETLEDFRRLPGACKEWDGAGPGHLELEVGGGKLVFAPAAERANHDGDRVGPWTEIKAIKVIEIVDNQRHRKG